jgi:hypothetical protein
MLKIGVASLRDDMQFLNIKKKSFIRCDRTFVRGGAIAACIGNTRLIDNMIWVRLS